MWATRHTGGPLTGSSAARSVRFPEASSSRVSFFRRRAQPRTKRTTASSRPAAVGRPVSSSSSACAFFASIGRG